jgi:hypothetical protein
MQSHPFLASLVHPKLSYRISFKIDVFVFLITYISSLSYGGFLLHYALKILYAFISFSIDNFARYLLLIN